MKFVVALVLLAALVAGRKFNPLREVAKVHGKQHQWPQFVSWAAVHGRHYKTVAEVHTRYENFKASLVRSAHLNKINPYATFGPNKFSDYSVEEFRRTHLMPHNSTGAHKALKYNPKKWVPLPVKRTKDGKVADANGPWDSILTPIKDQQQCGSCWAFSATETIESACAQAGHGLQVLAPEQIVDCDTNDQGCGGGDPREAIGFVANEGGQEGESTYPYTAGGGQAGSCQFSSGSVEEDPKSSVDVTDGTEESLMSFIQSSGPPSVCVDASSWQDYTGGVLTSCTDNIDHAVQAVDINSDQGQQAYQVRNSWGAGWGVNGFIYLATGQNMCAIANEVSYATC